MRIWSIHPKYLDSKGLVALWREGLLAKNVLEGKTKGYKNHPQLNRFKEADNPVDAINQYLMVIHEEAVRRGYNFDKSKLKEEIKPTRLRVTDGQIKYESEHLLKKLQIRDERRFVDLQTNIEFKPHPMFSIINGEIEEWEVL